LRFSSFLEPRNLRIIAVAWRPLPVCIFRTSYCNCRYKYVDVTRVHVTRFLIPVPLFGWWRHFVWRLSMSQLGQLLTPCCHAG